MRCNEEYVKDHDTRHDMKARMDEYVKFKCMHLVWISDKFGKPLPDEANEYKTYKLLQYSHYDGLLSQTLVDGVTADDAFRIVDENYKQVLSPVPPNIDAEED